MKIIQGERVGRLGRVMVGCSAVVFDPDDPAHERVLLTQRADNRRWCLPGGQLEAGERVAEACLRELLEETGAQGRISHLIGVYSNPDYLLEYADGNRYHLIGLCFAVELTGGVLRLSDETLAYGYFTQAQIAAMDVLETHRERLADAFAGRTAVVS